MRLLLRSGLPAAIIVASLLIVYAVRPRDSGVDVRVVVSGPCRRGRCAERPFAALVQVRRVTTGEVVAGHRAPASGRFRFRLDPGRYELLPVAGTQPRAPRARPVPVQVRNGRFAKALVRYRAFGRR